MIEANWLIFVAALLVGLVVAYWVFVHGSRPAQRERRADVLDEGTAPAQRNQALIDAPPAATFEAPAPISPPAMAGTMAGIGELIAVAAQEEVDRSQPAPLLDETGGPAEVPVASVSAPSAGDDLLRIKGLGPKMKALLASLGITSYAQIAGWSDADLDDLDGKLGAFAGRPRRDKWVEQARLLASGDTGAYEAEFGKL